MSLVLFFLLTLLAVTETMAQEHLPRKFRARDGIVFQVSGKERMEISPLGNVLVFGLNGKNVTTINQTLLDKYSLFVEEGVLSEDFAMAPGASWADYVFEEDYKLPHLTEVEAFIKTNKHLPNIPAQAEVEQNGYSMHVMNVKMLEKIEELTLYIIAQEKEITNLKQQLGEYASMRSELETLKKAIAKEGQ